MAKKLSLLDKLVAKLRKLGLSERKAVIAAKALAPTARAAVKAELAVKEGRGEPEKKGKVKGSKAAAKGDADFQSASDLSILGKKAIRVNGHSLRLDLPVVPMPGIKGIEILRVMDGLSSTATYLVAAVKGDLGIVAIRKLTSDCFNVKFYPDMAYWDKTQGELASLGATYHLKREHYERMHFGKDPLDQLLKRLEAEAKPKSRVKALLDRLLAISTPPLLKAFEILYTRSSQRVA